MHGEEKRNVPFSSLVGRGTARFQYGCVGRLGVVVLVLVATVVVLGVAAVTALPEQVEDHVVIRQIPVAAPRRNSPVGASSSRSGRRSFPSSPSPPASR